MDTHSPSQPHVPNRQRSLRWKLNDQCSKHAIRHFYSNHSSLLKSAPAVNYQCTTSKLPVYYATWVQPPGDTISQHFFNQSFIDTMCSTMTSWSINSPRSIWPFCTPQQAHYWHTGNLNCSKSTSNNDCSRVRVLRELAHAIRFQSWLRSL